MENIIQIMDTPIQIKEWAGQRVITFQDIDTVHKRERGTASRNFRENRDKFIEGTDFFKIPTDEIRRLEFQNDKFYCFGTADEIRCQFVRPSVGRSTAFLPVVVSLYPLPSNLALWAVCGPVTGFYFFCCSRTFL